jgi:hypothetical protein
MSFLALVLCFSSLLYLFYYFDIQRINKTVYCKTLSSLIQTFFYVNLHKIKYKISQIRRYRDKCRIRSQSRCASRWRGRSAVRPAASSWWVWAVPVQRRRRQLPPAPGYSAVSQHLPADSSFA